MCIVLLNVFSFLHRWSIHPSPLPGGQRPGPVRVWFGSLSFLPNGFSGAGSPPPFTVPPTWSDPLVPPPQCVLVRILHHLQCISPPPEPHVNVYLRRIVEVQERQYAVTRRPFHSVVAGSAVTMWFWRGPNIALGGNWGLVGPTFVTRWLGSIGPYSYCSPGWGRIRFHFFFFYVQNKNVFVKN